ncbi:hypothetical protein GPECTOR_22g957 [Gonium pectorale]|uniref:Pherophorin domain-containing protein n=1 Tax=Gonium pectorale TaxID=33097 RepID=A0A150GHU8_GONPE|nr:hypothetical protein GPECTOR_22g957 [Gonium pectorale]|eukprot:KXZ49363.1 hypothetical protein GPECTOR_22g957 [Gonium pectorale]
MAKCTAIAKLIEREYAGQGCSLSGIGGVETGGVETGGVETGGDAAEFILLGSDTVQAVQGPPRGHGLQGRHLNVERCGRRRNAAATGWSRPTSAHRTAPACNCPRGPELRPAPAPPPQPPGRGPRTELARGHPANAARTPRLSSSSASVSSFTTRLSSRALLSAGFESGPLGPNACVLNTGAYSDVDPTDDNGAAVTCRDQFNCIDLLFDGDCTTATEQGTGIAYHYCKVCLFWSQGRDCPKSTSDAISHVCAADRLLGVVHTPGQPPATGDSSTGKQENWDDGFNERFCQYVRFNATDQFQHVYFTVKDGANANLCLLSNETSLNVTLGGIQASCSRPRVVGGNRPHAAVASAALAFAAITVAAITVTAVAFSALAVAAVALPAVALPAVALSAVALPAVAITAIALPAVAITAQP